MSSIEQQISCVEKKLLENELLIKRYKEEMECCHQLWLDQEVAIDQLDQQMLDDDELDELVVKARGYEDEMQGMKRALSRCEADIGDCRQKINRLMDELEQCERREAEAKLLSELDREECERQMLDQLARAVRDKNKEIEAQVRHRLFCGFNGR